jgi:hypothetical protein
MGYTHTYTFAVQYVGHWEARRNAYSILQGTDDRNYVAAAGWSQ